MIAALVQGTLVRAPEQKTSKAGHSYVSATLKVRDGDATQWVRVTAFSNTAQADLLRLADGDALSAQGRLSAEIYTGIDNIPKISLSIVADQILPLRQPPRANAKRKPQRNACADHGATNATGLATKFRSRAVSMKSSRFDDSNPNYPNDVWDKVDKCWVPKASIKADKAALLNGEAIAPEFSEDALALRFADLHADKLRYVAQWGKWLAWTGTHWESENTLAVFDMARKICRDAAGRCNKPAEAKGLSKAKTVAAVEMLARSDRRIAAC
jgi:single-stranded DNA-binding protein